jgi:hypothetical protein
MCIERNHASIVGFSIESEVRIAAKHVPIRTERYPIPLGIICAVYLRITTEHQRQ